MSEKLYSPKDQENKPAPVKKWRCLLATKRDIDEAKCEILRAIENQFNSDVARQTALLKASEQKLEDAVKQNQ